MVRTHKSYSSPLIIRTDDEPKSSTTFHVLSLLLFFVLIVSMRSMQKQNVIQLPSSQSFPLPKFPSNASLPKKYLSSVLAANSRLGNHLFELSSLYGISKQLKRIPTFFIHNHFHEEMLRDTDFLIPGLLDHFLIVNKTIPTTIKAVDFGRKCCIYEDPVKLKVITDEYLHLAGHHYQSWKYFARMRNELMGYLRNPTHNFTQLPKSNKEQRVMCIHIRRTDFVGTGFHTAEDKFILNSIGFMKEEEQRNGGLNVTTVLFGDDFGFMENLVNQTHEKWKDMNLFISNNSPSDDIIYSKLHCDAVLITSPHSTFGWWMGFLSKRGQVYYNDIRFTNDHSILHGNFLPEDYYPPHWIPVRYNQADNTTVIESLK